MSESDLDSAYEDFFGTGGDEGPVESLEDVREAKPVTRNADDDGERERPKRQEPKEPQFDPEEIAGMYSNMAKEATQVMYGPRMQQLNQQLEFLRQQRPPEDASETEAEIWKIRHEAAVDRVMRDQQIVWRDLMSDFERKQGVAKSIAQVQREFAMNHPKESSLVFDRLRRSRLNADALADPRTYREELYKELGRREYERSQRHRMAGAQGGAGRSQAGGAGRTTGYTRQELSIVADAVGEEAARALVSKGRK